MGVLGVDVHAEDVYGATVRDPQLLAELVAGERNVPGRDTGRWIARADVLNAAVIQWHHLKHAEALTEGL